MNVERESFTRPSAEPEKESAYPTLERLCSEKEARIVSELREIVINKDEEPHAGIEQIGAGKDLAVFRVVESPGVVYKIVRRQNSSVLQELSADVAKMAAHTRVNEKTQIGDHALMKIARGIPACAFLRDGDDQIVAVLSEEAIPAHNDWNNAFRAVPILEEQGLATNDFRAPENFGEVKKPDGTVEPVILDLGSVKLLSEMNQASYGRYREIARRKASGEPLGDLLK